ncbi:hypothetical protein Q7C36_001503 [Tachysurus vachellii]|uniref:Uncharacterized protein n=1 Tax=Tachysurus vachellii TaxID=175792 RepID=A0AA88NXU8_TACVA|nr:hypothetical protein Q7C36_001503 [Tachysurus vachellii]
MFGVYNMTEEQTAHFCLQVKARKTSLSFLLNQCYCRRCSELFGSEAAGHYKCTYL